MNISFYSIPQYKNIINKQTTSVTFKGRELVSEDTFTPQAPPRTTSSLSDKVQGIFKNIFSKTQVPLIKKDTNSHPRPLSQEEIEQLREKLLKNKILKKSLFLESYINKILEHVNTANIDDLNLLLNHAKIKYVYEEKRAYFICEIFNNITDENKDLFKYVLNHAKSDVFEVNKIMENLNVQNKDVLKPLLNNEKVTALETYSILSKTNKDNKDVIPLLLRNKKVKGNHIFSIMFHTNKENKKEIDYLLNHDKVRDGKQISLILSNLSQENKSILRELLEHKMISNGELCGNILAHIHKENKDVIIPLMDYAKTFSLEMMLINSNVNKYNKKILMNLILNKKKPRDISQIAEIMQILTNENLAYIIKNQDIEKIIEKVENQHKLMLKEPELYTNTEEESSTSDMIDEINKFWKNNSDKTYLVASLFDKETLNNFFRLRLYGTYEYFAILKTLDKESLERVYKMNLCTNVEGKPFTPTQKIEFIDLISAYQNNKLDMSLIDEMIQNGKLDLEKLNFNLFKQVMINLDISEENIVNISKEKFLAWDLKYIHLLAKEIETQKSLFADIIWLANFAPDFKSAIMANGFGYNQQTKRTFKDLGIDFQKWLYPSKEIETSFVIKDENKEKLKLISSQIIEDINSLREGREKFIDKQIRQFIKNGKFVIPQSALTSHTVLIEFINNLIKQLKPIWELAEKNTSNQDKDIALKAKNTLTILFHLKQRLDDISQLKINNSNKSSKNIDWTIKMWDRIPQKDLFQGNYSTCCIGMGGGNGETMPVYLLNTAFNMIEIVDNETGKTVGNALCYFIKNKNNTISFVIDNVEINNIHKLSKKAGLEFREKLLEYSTKLTKDLTGRDDVSIILGANYNDIPDEDLPKYKQKISLIGELCAEGVYLDLYDGWIKQKDLNKSITFLKLK